MCSLDTISDLDANVHDAEYAVVTDARRGQVYWAVYDARGNRIEGPDIAPPAEVAARLGGRVRRLIGPVASEHPEAFADFVVTGPRWPDAATIAAGGARGGGPPPAGRRARGGAGADPSRLSRCCRFTCAVPMRARRVRRN